MNVVIPLMVVALVLVVVVLTIVRNSHDVLKTQVLALSKMLSDLDNRGEVKRLSATVKTLERKVDVMEQEKYFGVIIDEYYVIGLSDDGEPQLGGWVHNIKQFTKKRAESIASEFGGAVIDMRTREGLIE